MASFGNGLDTVRYFAQFTQPAWKIRNDPLPVSRFPAGKISRERRGTSCGVKAFIADCREMGSFCSVERAKVLRINCLRMRIDPIFRPHFPGPTPFSRTPFSRTPFDPIFPDPISVDPISVGPHFRWVVRGGPVGGRSPRLGAWPGTVRAVTSRRCATPVGEQPGLPAKSLLCNTLAHQRVTIP
jgi:hypothetical protein